VLFFCQGRGFMVVHNMQSVVFFHIVCQGRVLLLACLLACCMYLNSFRSIQSIHPSIPLCFLNHPHPSIVYCLLSTVYCLLSTVYCLLSTVYCLLSTVYCLLSTVYCLLSTVYSLLSTVYKLTFCASTQIPSELSQFSKNENSKSLTLYSR